MFVDVGVLSDYNYPPTAPWLSTCGFSKSKALPKSTGAVGGSSYLPLHISLPVTALLQMDFLDRRPKEAPQRLATAFAAGAQAVLGQIQATQREVGEVGKRLTGQVATTTEEGSTGENLGLPRPTSLGLSAASLRPPT